MTEVAASDTEASRATSQPASREPSPAGEALRLNAFQVLMRRWRDLHPYNAGQAMRVSGRPDMERWRQAVTETIREVGLGTPVVGEKGWKVAFRPVDEVPVDRVEGELAGFTNVELNRPFSDDELPIRFTALCDAGDSYLLVAIYDHWIADSRAMRELMHRIWERYRDQRGQTKLPPLTMKAPHFNRLFRKYIGYLYRSRAVQETLKNIYRHRHAYRMHLRDPKEFESHMIYTPLPGGVIAKVHAFAKSRGASVNDVFLAVLGQLMGEHTATERYKPKKKKRFHFARDQIGLGTIVDIRDSARQSLDQVFGLYLSSYTVVLKKPEQTSLGELIGVISQRTKKIKKNNTAVKGYTALMMARMSWDLLPKLGKRHLQCQLFSKNVPVAAGTSNVNMSKSWVDNPADAPRGDVPVVLDYLRISPAGPLIPLVFTLTTIRDRLSLCCTYRTTAFTGAQAQEIVERFIERLVGVGA